MRAIRNRASQKDLAHGAICFEAAAFSFGHVEGAEVAQAARGNPLLLKAPPPRLISFPLEQLAV
jgi:hypothetical protein